MKLFEVIFEEERETKREPGKATTPIERVQMFFAACLIDEVWTAVDWIRTGGPERTLISVAEVAPAVTVIGASSAEGQ